MHLGGAEEAWVGKHRGGQDEDTTHFSFAPRVTSAARTQRVAEDARVRPDSTPVLLMVAGSPATVCSHGGSELLLLVSAACRVW